MILLSLNTVFSFFFVFFCFYFFPPIAMSNARLYLYVRLSQQKYFEYFSYEIKKKRKKKSKYLLNEIERKENQFNANVSLKK